MKPTKKRIVHCPEYFPKRPIWLVFDLCNGDSGKCRYVWWFDTRKDAREHTRWQRRDRRNADLAGPVKFVPSNTLKGYDY